MAEKNNKSGGKSSGERNTSYYKSHAKITPDKSRNPRNFRGHSKKRGINNYIKTLAVIFIFVGTGVLITFLGIKLGDIVENTTETAAGSTVSVSTATTDNTFIPTNTESNFTVPNTTISQTSEISDVSIVAANMSDAQIKSNYNSFHGAYVDLLQIENEEKLTTLITKLQAKNINAVMLDIKNLEGEIPYASKVETASSIGALKVNANLPIERVMELFHTAGFYVSGRLTCFKDNLAAVSFPNYSILTQATNLRWVDNENSRWINIYVEGSRTYIKNLSIEAAEIGFDEIILNYFFLPNVTTASEIIYNDGGISKNDIIREFVNTIMLAVDDVNPSVKVGIDIPVRYFLTIPHISTGIDPDQLVSKCDFITTSFAPADIPTSLNVNGAKITNADNKPYSAVTSLCKHFGKFIENGNFRPMIQAFDSGGIYYNDTKIEEQKKALTEAGINVWLLLNYKNQY